jgi:hypothetical protein
MRRQAKTTVRPISYTVRTVDKGNKLPPDHINLEKVGIF